MTPIELPLRDIGASTPCRPDQLVTVEHELTPEEVERITDAGEWKDYRAEDYRRTLLPVLGDERLYSERVPIYTSDSYHWGEAAESRPTGVVVPIGGRNYRVSLRVLAGDRDEVYEARGKTLVLVPTDEPPTPPDVKAGKKPSRRSAYLKFFGQPTWIQGEYFPQDLRGEPCHHLVTVENGWGDSGNWNILIGLDADGVPNVAYFEASCC